MKTLRLLLLFLIPAMWTISCNGDYRPVAKGQFGDVVVVMDSSKWNSPAADAIRGTFGGDITTLPNVEPRFDLRFVDIRTNEELERVKDNKNIIVAAGIDDDSNTGAFVRALLSDEVENRVRSNEAFAFPFENRWYRDQWTLILTSTSDSALAAKIRNSETRLVRNLMDKELARWTYEIYRRGEQTDIADTLWNRHGWKIRVQHDYSVHLDTTHTDSGGRTAHFFTMRRFLADNDRWFWAWWRDDVTDIGFLDNDWINAKRDSVMRQWIQGSRENSYLTTEYRRPVLTETFEYKGNLAYETLGTWRMVNDAMGGPFVNMTVYDEATNRLFIIEFGQFTPRYDKRRFVRQFRAMVRTFESDSTWNRQNEMASY